MVTSVSDLFTNTEKSETVSILAPSGAGKTTFVRMIAGIEKLDAGEISIAADSSTQCASTFRFNDQNKTMLPWKTVFANLLFAGSANRKSRIKRAEFLLGEVGLEGFRDRWPDDLSSGEKVRTSVAMSLMSPP